MTERLQDLGYKLFLAQRDGFEKTNFAKLVNRLEGFLSGEEQISHAVSWIIYLLDLYNCYLSDVCVACLDEPLDPGMIVEVMFAKMMNKPVIGYRTEMRTPYGTSAECHTGMHFFLFYPCDKFISLPNDFMRTRAEGH